MVNILSMSSALSIVLTLRLPKPTSAVNVENSSLDHPPDVARHNIPDSTRRRKSPSFHRVTIVAAPAGVEGA